MSFIFINFYSSLETKTKTVLTAPGFWEYSNGRWPVDSQASVSAIAQNDLDTIKQKAPNKILKIGDPPNIQVQVANGQLEKLLARATLEIEIGKNIFAEHFVVKSKLTAADTWFAF